MGDRGSVMDCGKRREWNGAGDENLDFRVARDRWAQTKRNNSRKKTKVKRTENKGWEMGLSGRF
jgi:hypothetical protein